MATITDSKRPEIHGQDCCAEKGKIFNASCEPVLTKDNDSGPKGKGKRAKVMRYSKEMSDEDYKLYLKQIKESGGFDVDRFEGSRIGMMKPVLVQSQVFQEKLPYYCEEAIQVYNTNEKTNYQFHEVVKAVIKPLCGAMFFITFKARDPSDQTSVIFQARVLRKIMNQGIEVVLCRKKPTQ